MNNLKEIIATLLLNNHCYIQYNNKKICGCVIGQENVLYNYQYGSSNLRSVLPLPILEKSKLYKPCDVDRWLFINIDYLNEIRKRIQDNS